VTGTLIRGFNDLVSEMGSIPAAIWEMLATASEYWLQFFGEILGISKETTDGISQFFSDLSAWIFSAADSAWQFFSDLGAWITHVFTSAYDTAVAVIGGIVDVFRGAYRVIDNIIGGIAETAAGIFSAMGDILEGNFKSAGQTMVKTLTNAAGRAADAVDVVTGGSLFEGKARETAEELGDILAGTSTQEQGQRLAEKGFAGDSARRAEVQRQIAAKTKFNPSRQRSGLLPATAQTPGAHIGGTLAPSVAMASPAVAAQAASVNQSINQTTSANITVNAAPGMDERQIAQRIKQEIENAEGNRLRAAKAAFAPQFATSGGAT